MSDTPRTDAEAKKSEGDYYLDGTVDAEFARQLERELATAIKERDGARQHIDNVHRRDFGFPPA